MNNHRHLPSGRCHKVNLLLTCVKSLLPITAVPFQRPMLPSLSFEFAINNIPLFPLICSTDVASIGEGL